MRPDLPRGTVTFLFTDIAGSTRLLDALGAEGYADALAAHRTVIREAAGVHGGVEVDTQGDAFFIAFPTAGGAVEAASLATERLADGPVQVRMGLHTGAPLVTDEGYVGPDVHLAARIAATAHGAQIVLSGATRAMLEPTVPIRDLGEHRLKDIDRPIAIHQVGDGEFPPLRSIANTNLPTPVSSFLGRADDLAAIDAALGSERLVTLTGPGGTGKTRLAVEAARRRIGSFPAGVWWVELATITDVELLMPTVAGVLGAERELVEHIGDRRLLLVLDNLEQVAAVGPEIAALLAHCPGLVVLATSRTPLKVGGEREVRVASMAQDEAIALFEARSGLTRSPVVEELCRRLDSMPLPVELAASRSRTLGPQAILDRLGSRLDLLRGGRDRDPRQQTLRATIAWSEDLLDRESRRLFARLAVFVGGCSLDAAETVLDADLDALETLVEQSLVRQTDGRFWMLETIRAYATERFAECAGRKCPR